MRHTHTFVELEISRQAYLEIYTLLAEAGYHHTFIDGVIDMNGIALTMKKDNDSLGNDSMTKSQDEIKKMLIEEKLL